MSKAESNYFPVKGDRVQLNKELGTVLDNDFDMIEWDNGDIEEWSGLFESFQDLGGFVINKTNGKSNNN